MAGGIDWFRWHHGSVTDPKFQLVARRSGASLPDVLAVWAYILEKASAATDRGCFGEIDAEALDCLFGFPETETRTADILRAMEARGLLAGVRIARWEDRQPKRERDQAPISDDADRPMTPTERSRKHRQKQGHQSPDEAMQRHATPRNASNDQETPREEKSREELIPPATTAGAGAGDAEVIAITEAWLPSDRFKVQAKLQGLPVLNAEAMAEGLLEFIAYWIARPNELRTQAEWEHTLAKSLKHRQVKAAGQSTGAARSSAARSTNHGAHNVEEPA